MFKRDFINNWNLFALLKIIYAQNVWTDNYFLEFITVARMAYLYFIFVFIALPPTLCIYEIFVILYGVLFVLMVNNKNQTLKQPR